MTADSTARDEAVIGMTAFDCSAEERARFRALAARFGMEVRTTDGPPSESTVELAAGNRSISVSHRVPLTGVELRALRAVGVRHVSTRSIGVDHIDLDCAADLDIQVDNVTYSPHGVADFTVMLLLMVLRGAKPTLARVENHDYRHGDPASELRDMTVGVVGTGRIGSAVVERLGGFGCRLLAWDRRSERRTDVVDLDELLQRSDIVTLHIPLTNDTHHLLDRDRIGSMRRGALLINTSRGGLVDTAALVSALEDGRIGGAALDVVEGENAIFNTAHDGALDHPLLVRLLALPSVIVTPHVAYLTRRALDDAVEGSIHSCLRFAGCQHDG